jgi:4-hydroxybenzoate polyprenyltransferase
MRKPVRKHPLPPALRAFLVQLWEYARLMRLDRPIGIWLLLWPTLWALWVSGEGQPSAQVFTVFVLGVLVMRSAGCVINDWADRDIDPQVRRTADRPLAARTVSPPEALALFTSLSLVAIALVLTLNPLTWALAAGAGALTVIYPFCKRYITLPQLVLGAAFGWSIPMAWAAQTGGVSRVAWLWFLCVVVWALVYDTLYAMADRDEDRRIGVKSTAILFGAADLFIISLLMGVLVLGLALAGRESGLGLWYGLGLGGGTLVLLRQRWLIRARDPHGCFAAFLESRHFGAAVFAGIVLDYTL